MAIAAVLFVNPDLGKPDCQFGIIFQTLQRL